MVRDHLARVASVVSLLLLSGAPLFGQASFSVASAASGAANVGVTELTGLITLTVFSGTTVAAPLSIHYSAPITNNSMLEVQVYGTGGLTGVALHPTLDLANNSILINVPGGGNVGSQMQIAGVRVAIPGLEEDRVTAKITGLTAGGNTILVGQNLATVIDRFLPPFSVALNSMLPLEFRNGVASQTSASFLIKEGFATAFSDRVGFYGQTAPTRFRIKPFPSIPAGVKLAFAPNAASTETLAVLRTTSGVTERIPRADGSTDVEYEFVSDPVGTSAATVEFFRFFVTVSEVSSTAHGSVTFQATLEPIGLAQPDEDFPSTDIPRYSELTLPDETDLLTGTVELAFPFRARSDATYTGIAITNPLDFRVRISLEAYDSNGLLITGSDITNPVSLILPRKGQYAKLATEIFGKGFNAGTLGSIRMVGNASILAGFYLQGKESGSGLDGATAAIVPMYRFVWPAVLHQGPSAYTLLELFNPGTALARVNADLTDSAGRKIATATQEVMPGGTVLRDVRDLFGTVDLNSLSGGYVSARTEVPVVAGETFGDALDFNVLTAQAPVQQTKFYIAHFASGGGYQTELSLVNLDVAIPASVTFTAFDNNGTPFSVSGNPAKLLVAPTTQLAKTVAELFPGFPAVLQTGYIQVDVEPVSVGYFTSVPPLAGYVRFSSADGYGSSALPLGIPAASDFVYSHVAQNAGYYTGIALLNTNQSPTSITLEVFKPDGGRTGILSTFLQPGQKLSKLLYEFIPASLGQIGGYIRISSALPITSFSLFGTNDGYSLSAIPPQSVQTP